MGRTSWGLTRFFLVGAGLEVWLCFAHWYIMGIKIADQVSSVRPMLWIVVS